MLRGDVARLAALPRREPPAPADDGRWRVPGGQWQLRPHQAAALAEVAEVGGGLLGFGVGAGKTLVALLLPCALGLSDDECLVLVPGALRAEYARQRAVLAEHFDVANPRVLSYEQLGHPKSANALEALAPKLIVADEAHLLGNKDSARTARFLRYVRSERPVFVAMSASLLRRSLHDAAHLAELALGDGSPLPKDWNLRERWSAALFGTSPAYPEYTASLLGGLRAALGEPQLAIADVRAAFMRHLRCRPGVLFTDEQSCAAPLVSSHLARWPSTPRAWRAAQAHVAASLELPCGQGVDDELRKLLAVRTLGWGFYSRWAEVDGPLVDREWYYARKAWAQALAALVDLRRPGCDSPALALAVVEADGLPPRCTPAHKAAILDARAAWAGWQAAAHRYHGRREVVYLDGAEAWAAELVQAFDAQLPRGTLVWSAHPPLSELIAAHRPAAVVPVGEHPDTLGSEPAWRVVSVASHGTGLNLQGYHTNLLLTPPSDASCLEQLLGRTHRPGQQASEVRVLLPPHEDLSEQIAAARALEEMTGTKQRLVSMKTLDTCAAGA